MYDYTQLIALASCLCFASAAEPIKLKAEESDVIKYKTSITCSSTEDEPAQCMAPNNVRLWRVTVANQLSNSSCTVDETFGLTVDRKGVWATKGCSAEFEVAGRELKAETIECSSWNFKPAKCRPDCGSVVKHIWVEKQNSRSDCVINVSFGVTVDRRGVWVNHGCRAVFGFL